MGQGKCVSRTWRQVQGHAFDRTRHLLYAAVILILPGCTSGAPFYLVQQGFGQARILLSRQPLDRVMEDPALGDSDKKKLLHMGRVRQFAKSLGLQDTESFRSYVPIEGNAVSWVVSAAPALDLRPLTWWFPIVGSVPYLGFFDREEAFRFQEHLRRQGYDTHVGQVAAYSTLGWFADPVFSSQLSYSEAYLTGLVIHEMVHSTVWVPGRPDFNEALATFVEERGRMLYYETGEGADSQTIRRIQAFQRKEREQDTVLDKAENQLRSLYASSQSDSEKRAEKARILEELRNSLTVIEKGQDSSGSEWNNARFATRAVYRPNWPVFDRTLDECKGDLRCFIAKYKAYAQDLKASEERFEPGPGHEGTGEN